MLMKRSGIAVAVPSNLMPEVNGMYINIKYIKQGKEIIQ